MEQDKATVLAVWLAMGGKEDVLTRIFLKNYGDWETLDKPSDDVSDWHRVTVDDFGSTYWLDGN